MVASLVGVQGWCQVGVWHAGVADILLVINYIDLQRSAAKKPAKKSEETSDGEIGASDRSEGGLSRGSHASGTHGPPHTVKENLKSCIPARQRICLANASWASCSFSLLLS
jgi:hypothetical protein